MTDFSQPFSIGGVPILSGLGGSGVVAYRKVYFCDSAKGNDSNTGLSVEEAFASVQSALDVVRDEDTIVVFKGTGNYDEKLITGQNIRYAAMADGRGRNVTLAGAVPTSLPYNSPQLYNVSGLEYTLFIRSPGWRVTGLRIVGDTGAPRGILAEMAQAGNTADTNYAPGLQIDHCTFLGNVDALSRGFVSSALVFCRILDNLFTGFTLAAMGEELDGSLVTRPAFSFPQYHILGNIFADNKRNIDVPCQATLIKYNDIGLNRINSLVANGGIDLDGGSGNNLVTKNYLSGTYATGGAYRKAQSTDTWHGNDVPAGGTGTTAGMSTGLPGQ